MKRPLPIYFLSFLHIFLGLGGAMGGAMFIIEPDGSLLGMDISWLANSPFNSFVIPGLILFLFNGVLPLLTFIGLISKPNWSWPEILNIFPDRHWSWAFSIYVGIIVIAWIAIQQMLTQFFWLQPVMIITGILIIIFTLMPSIMRYFSKQ